MKPTDFDIRKCTVLDYSGRKYKRTYRGDICCRYTIGNGGLGERKEENWHRIGNGLYILGDHWLQPDYVPNIILRMFIFNEFRKLKIGIENA